VKRRKSILANEPSIEDLEFICDVLNAKQRKEVTPELVRLVTAWQESGPNLQAMMAADFELWREVQDAWEAKWLPTNTGGAMIALFPSLSASKMRLGRDGEKTPEGEALLLFYTLTLGFWEKLCDRPCARCGKYYIKTRRDQKSYCGQRCGSLASAKASTRKRLDENHREKLERAKTAIQKWDASKIRPAADWKQWAHKREPDITPKWLTRAVNKNELQPPKKEGRHAKNQE
jgi:hypothetical protein